MTVWVCETTSASRLAATRQNLRKPLDVIGRRLTLGDRLDVFISDLSGNAAPDSMNDWDHHRISKLSVC